MAAWFLLRLVLFFAFKPDVVPAVTATVRESVEHFRPNVPLIGMDWGEGIANWSDKKTGQIKIRAPEMMK